MRQNVRRWLYSAGAVAAAGAMAAAGQGIASAEPSAVAAPATTSQATAAGQVTAAYKPPSKPLYLGERGAAVRSVQRRLSDLHYYLGKVDGSYGQDTLEAAWAFREAQNLPMNETTGAQPIDKAFLRALVHPWQPYVMIKHGPATRIEVNLKRQLLVLYKHGRVALITHVSSGGGYYFCNPPSGGGGCGYAVTPDGNFFAYSFQSGWVTVPLGTMYNPIWVDPAAGVAIHGDIPVPWYPVSHGCIRVWLDVADVLHNMITVGGAHPTPVYVRGTAPYQPSLVG
jgi:peptidoglycan hydrolase-like protein with peptidoglycan-binding domain